ncbi:hypothetical protein [Spirosoma foliorum]|uniref:Uncharacterized protein n=1 Tax=Spirosoma foliorum TaxID=2710596 RepID=A0A7G5H5G2_9BACT|nr:hypothetical protein [Spirosoma foliorum]QMW06354.1 hypothetical protein H3H32_16420 [Spirosoma foliorum]
MAIQNLDGGDFVNQGVDKINEAFGEIPVSYVPTPDGNLIVTKHNGQTITVPLKNFFALLTTAFGSLAVAMATAEQAGKVLLVDSDKPEQFQSTGRVLTAAQVAELISSAVDSLDIPQYDIGRAFIGTDYTEFGSIEFSSPDFFS